MKNKTTGLVCADASLNQQPKKSVTVKFRYFFCLLAITFILQFFVQNSFSQVSGDYRSNAATMNWSTVASWQKYNGTSWATSTDYPGQNSCSGCTVTIQNAHTVTLNVSPANSVGAIIVGGGTNGTLTLGTFTLYDAGNLTVNAGATINLATGTFSVVGTTSTAGTISDASNTGVNTFTGLVTKTAGTWTSTSVTTASNMIFSGGFTNSAGAFSAGAATIGDNQTLTGTVNMSFANGLNVLGNADLNIAGTTAAGVSFAGTAINYAVRNLTLTGLLTVSTTGNLTVSGTTTITGSGAFTDNNNTGITSFAALVTHNSIGNFTTTSVTTAANMIFTNGFTNTAGGFNAGAATVGDNQTLTGTVNMSFANGLIVLGNADVTIAGTATTGVSFAGTAINYTVRNLTLTGRLTVSTTGNLTVTGSTSITGSGSFNETNNTGITSFNGPVTHNSTGGWFSTAVTTAANMVFNAGFTNTLGSFSAGGASLPTGQTLSGTILMTFNNPVTIGGTGNVTISGAGGVRFSGTAMNYLIPGNLTLTGTLLVNTTGNFTVTGTTSIIGAGDFTDNNNAGISTFTGLVTHNSTGRWVSTSVTTPANMIFTAGFTNTAGTFSAGGATIGDNKTLTGTVNMSFNRGITVLGLGDITIAGTATTGVTFGGTLINYLVRNLSLTGLLTVSTSGNLTVSGTTSASGTGKFLDNNGTGITTFTGLVTVGSTSTFTATAVTTIGRLIFAGGITHNNTTPLSFNAGTIRTSATQSWSGAGDIRSAGVLDVNVGTLTNNITGTVTVGGTLTGTTFVQGTNAKLALSNGTPLTITTLTSTATGNVVTYNGGTATMRSQTYHHLIVAGAGNKIISTTDITVNGDITISSGVLSNTTNNRNLILAGSWINNIGAAGFTAGTGTVIFSGSAAQILGGTGTTTFNNLTLNNAAGINQSINSTISGVLTLTAGIISTGATTVIISSTGTVTRTSGYINGNEQRNIATGANVTRTYDIGDATNYTPVTVTFASVSVAGNVTVKSTGTDHPLIVSSYLNAGLSVNRYYTLSNIATTFTTYTAVVNFLASDKDASTNTANLIAGRYAGSWTYPTVGTKTSTSTQVTGLTAFGDLALAEQLSCSTPTLIITDPAAFCSPATVNLTLAAVTAGSTSGLTFTYWNDVAATSSLPSPSAVSVAGTYYIKGTVPLGGCAEVKPVIVSRMNPTGVISGTATVCTGSGTSLNIAVTGTGPWSGTLSNGTAFSGSTDPLSVNVSPLTNTTYTISTLSVAGCNAQAIDKTGSAIISLAPLPTTANAGPDQYICGLSATLAGNIPSVGTGSWSIVSGSGGSFGSVASPFSSFTGTAGVVYVLRWSISNSPCVVSDDDVIINFTSGIWTGSSDKDWNNTSNWCGGVIPSGIFDIIVTAGLPNYPSIAGNVSINNISVAPGASFEITATGILSITGTFSNSGTLINNGSVILNGNASQSFPGSSASIAAMNNLEIDNADGVLIDKSFSISGTLTSTAGLIDLTDKNITLLSNAAGTAKVAPVGGSFDYTGGGKFIIQRYMPARRAWRLLTAPVTNSNSIYDAWQNAGIYTPGAGTLITGAAGGSGMDSIATSSFKEYDVASQSLVPVINTSLAISSGGSGSADNNGYFIFVRGDRNRTNFIAPNTNVTILSSAGQLQTGPQNFTAASGAGKFTLIGNPYASPIDFNDITRTNLVKRFYVWDPSLNTVGGYVALDDIDNDGIFSKSVAGSSQTNIIESQQAFFVETVATGAASLTINESDKYDTVIAVAARPLSINESLSADLYLQNPDKTSVLADGVKAEFNDNFSDLVNYEDALKFGNVNETFALLRNGKALTIERRSIVKVTDTFFFKLTKTVQRNYQFRFTTKNMDNHGLIAYLEDSYLSTSIPIELNGITNLNFSVTPDVASAVANRFRIVFKSMSVLPVSFTSVKAYQKNHQVAVEWKVENETGINKYEIEKSVDGSNFSKINSVVATGNSHSAISYNVMDEKPVIGNNFYRIKSIGFGGDIRYSQVIKVVLGNTKTTIIAYPNPLQNNSINLQLNNIKTGIYAVRLINGSGQVVYTNELNITSSNTTEAVTVQQLLAKGLYQLEVKGPGDSLMQQQVIVQ